jgi:hypothetical protein
MAADWVRLTAGHKRWLASSVYNIALSCVGEDDEAIVDRRLNVHGCCCFLFLLLFFCFWESVVSVEEATRKCLCCDLVRCRGGCCM